MSAVLASKHQGKGVKMPTIKDIARIAGVSHGTVSNVLNGRGNVSVEKIEAVQRAAREVGLSVECAGAIIESQQKSGSGLDSAGHQCGTLLSTLSGITPGLATFTQRTG